MRLADKPSQTAMLQNLSSTSSSGWATACVHGVCACTGVEHPQIVLISPIPGGQWGLTFCPAPGPPSTNHLLCLAEVDVFLIPATRLGILDVHEADEGHGAATQQQDGEEHDDDRGGADELPLLHGLQVQVQAQGVGDGTPQAWGGQQRVRGEMEGGGEGSSIS